jgi:hypothetical protein
MSDQDIYKVLIEYIRDDNKFKADLLKDVGEIKTQTQLTNGKVLANTKRLDSLESKITKVEADIIIIQKKDETNVIVKQVNWRWLATIGTAVLFLVNIIVGLIVDWIKKSIN